jgi:hypothetical protein
MTRASRDLFHTLEGNSAMLLESKRVIGRLKNNARTQIA